MLNLLTGAIAALCFTAALFFYRFWRQSQDRLLLFFSISFAILGVERVAIGWLQIINETLSGVYVLRLVAFSIILVAIVDKNRGGDRSA